MALGESKSSSKVSIGMPVFNGENTIRRALDSLLAQSFGDFELIISDNASVDATSEICAEYQARDSRVRYIRQPRNIGAVANFSFVYAQSRSPYFMWAAVDDYRSEGYIEENLKILESRPDTVFSSSPNCWEGRENDDPCRFEISGSLFERYRDFMRYCMDSHACFYSLMRTNALKDYDKLDADYLASDWSVNLHLLSKGEFGRTDGELLVLGNRGTSQRKDFLASYNRRLVHTVIPWFEFSLGFLGLIFKSRELTLLQRIYLFGVTIRFNVLRLFKKMAS